MFAGFKIPRLPSTEVDYIAGTHTLYNVLSAKQKLQIFFKIRALSSLVNEISGTTQALQSTLMTHLKSTQCRRERATRNLNKYIVKRTHSLTRIEYVLSSLSTSSSKAEKQDKPTTTMLSFFPTSKATEHRGEGRGGYLKILSPNPVYAKLPQRARTRS